MLGAVPQLTNTRFAVGVHVLTLLCAHVDEQTSSTRLALSVGSNAVHVRRVLGLLREAGLVTSRPGAAGGWQIACDPAEVTLRDVWAAVVGDARVLGVHAAAPQCRASRRIQDELWAVERRVAAAMAAELRRTTLADVLVATDAAAFSLPAA